MILPLFQAKRERLERDAEREHFATKERKAKEEVILT